MSEIDQVCYAWALNQHAQRQTLGSRFNPTGLTLNWSLLGAAANARVHVGNLNYWCLSEPEDNLRPYRALAMALRAQPNYPENIRKLHLSIKNYFFRASKIIILRNFDPVTTVSDVKTLFQLCQRWSMTVCRYCGELGHQVSTCSEATQPKAAARSLGMQAKTLAQDLHKAHMDSMNNQARSAVAAERLNEIAQMHMDQQKAFAFFNCNLPAEYTEYADALMENDSLLEFQQGFNQSEADVFDSFYPKELTKPDSATSLMASPTDIVLSNSQYAP